MTGRAIMFQGTGSDVGKSLIVAALCRIAHRRGLSVAPFKPQNMSNNAAACKGGGEIGRAQALQARACGLAPHVDFNPVLLKPETDRRAQLVVQGRVVGSLEADHYMIHREQLLDRVMESFDRLRARYDLVIVEGAGSPSEINLRDRDIANMGFARRANVPVCLIGDIDRGGVIASLVGTKAVLSPEDAAMISGFLINRFRGDESLFTDGVTAIEARTGWPCFGIVPWLKAAALLPAEDAVTLAPPSSARRDGLKIAAPMLSRLANFDDADPLRQAPGVQFEWIPPGRPLPRNADLIILFGTKSTLGDLAFLRAHGWDHDIIAHARSGGHVLGICGGYQMLGSRVSDPHGADGMAGEADGLGLLDVETFMTDEKHVRPVEGICQQSGCKVSGYEIHAGQTSGPDAARPMFSLAERPDGAQSDDGRISGTYLHGAFGSDAFRHAFLTRLGAETRSEINYETSVETALNALADGVEKALDIDALLALAG